MNREQIQIGVRVKHRVNGALGTVKYLSYGWRDGVGFSAFMAYFSVRWDNGRRREYKTLRDIVTAPPYYGPYKPIPKNLPG